MSRGSAIAGSLIVSLEGAGCTGVETLAPPLTTLRVHDGAWWIMPGDMHRYQCERGPLVCTAETSRLTRRLCRCVDAGGGPF